MRLLAIIATIAFGWMGSAFGYDYMNFPELGIIISIATMGWFIMTTISHTVLITNLIKK